MMHSKKQNKEKRYEKFYNRFFILKSTLLLVFTFYIMNFEAQNWYIGGNIAIKGNDQESKWDFDSVTPGFSDNSTIGEVTTNEMSIGIRPTIGYKLKNSDIGFYPTFLIAKKDDYGSREYTAGSSVTLETTSSNTKRNSIGAGFFYRYNFITLGRFSFLGRVDAGYTYSKSNFKNSGVLENKYINRVTERISNTERISHDISLGIAPIFEYKISERFSLFTDLNIRGPSCYFGRSEQSTLYDIETIIVDDTIVSKTYENRTTVRNDFSFNGSLFTNFSITNTFSIGLLVHF